MSTLWLVATPIGNLRDLSPRAVEVLDHVGLICCEDTRRTGLLLQHAGIKAERLAGTFLVVDDEPAVRAVALRSLSQLGLQVLEARDGAEGVAVYREHADDICGVLLDLTMPLMNGFEVMSQVRATNPTLPIILCSGYDRNEVITRSPPEPHCAFLPKPFTVEQLERAVRAALG